MRRTFRIGAVALVLSGCAAVLGIDDLPPAPTDGPDGSVIDAAIADHASDAPIEPNETGVADTGTPNDAGVDFDSGDAGIDFTVLIVNPDTTTPLGFDPSAVFWNESEEALYIADNDQDGGVWRWPGDGGAHDGARLPFTFSLSAGERFGQLTRVGTLFYVGSYAPDAGSLHQFNILGAGASTAYGSGAVFGVSSDVAGNIFFIAHDHDVPELLEFPVGGSGVAPSRINVTFSDASVGVVAETMLATIAIDKALVQFDAVNSNVTTSTFGTTVVHPGFLALGPNSSYLVGANNYIQMYTDAGAAAGRKVGLPDGGQLQNLGAFAYDEKSNRLFVPQAADGGPGQVLVFQLVSKPLN